MQRLCAGTVQTADMTAPVERAVAAFRHTFSLSLKPTSTAQQLAPIQAWRRAVARPSRRSHGAGFAVEGAEIW